MCFAGRFIAKGKQRTQISNHKEPRHTMAVDDVIFKNLFCRKVFFFVIFRSFKCRSQGCCSRISTKKETNYGTIAINFGVYCERYIIGLKEWRKRKQNKSWNRILYFKWICALERIENCHMFLCGILEPDKSQVEAWIEYPWQLCASIGNGCLVVVIVCKLTGLRCGSHGC